MIAHSTISDYAKSALKVAELFGHEKEGCAMHNDDKISRSAIGDLVRSRQHNQIDAFEEGNPLIHKAHKCAKYFSYEQRRSDLKIWAHHVEGGVPDTVPKTVICHTRIAARHKCIISLLKLNRALKRAMTATTHISKPEVK